MTYQPPFTGTCPALVGVTTRGYTVLADGSFGTWGPSSTGWVSADLAIYVPVVLPAATVVRRFWWANGSSVSASYNIDCGIYADAGYKPGTRLASTGNTAQGTASEIQFADVTDVAVGPGLYWIALAASSTSATLFRQNLSTALDAMTFYEEASARPLPATATPVEPAYGYLPVFGFATTASP